MIYSKIKNLTGEETDQIQALSREMGVSPLLAGVLVRRNRSRSKNS